MKHLSFLFTSLLLAPQVFSFSDPISNGGKYILTSEATGNSSYLGCGDDQLCSIIALSSAQEHDGWTTSQVHGSSWQFLIRDGTWSMDVINTTSNFSAASGEKIFANTNTAGGTSQLWDLVSQSDGAYELYNVFWKGALDVSGGDTPFVNGDVRPNGDLKGQYWTFRSVYPQVTTTILTTVTETVNPSASSTVTVTTTVCPQKVPTPFFPKAYPLNKNQKHIYWAWYWYSQYSESRKSTP